VDPAGGLALAETVEGPLEYTVWVARENGPLRLDRPRDQGPGFAPDPEVELLARRITRGIEDSMERAAAVESFLQTNYRYSLQGMARIGPDPVTWFLLRAREGHCEYFAGGMVVLLDAVGVPARMVGGYSGGDVSPSGDEALVREANAHTWVEVWAGPGRGWVVFDPTPAAGIPAFGRGRSRLRLRVVWEWVQASWDRYVLTYGLGEQLSLLGGILESVTSLLRRLHLRHLLIAALVGLVAWAASRASRWRRVTTRRGPRRGPAARAVERVRGRLQRSGASLPRSITVRGIGGAAAERWPGSESDLRWLVDQAERELYGSGSSAVQDRETRRLWRRLRGRLREPVS
jgi:hypothetical protein